MGVVPVWADVNQYLSEAECLAYAGTVDAWLAGDDRVTRGVLEAFLPRLRGISKWGTGLDSIDLDAAKALGIPVHNTAGAFSEAVAEVALGYMLMLTRYLLVVDRAVREGAWPKPQGLGLHGRTLGLVGYGAIGQGIARRARGCGMQIMAYDPWMATKGGHEDVEFVDLPALATAADVLCLACALTPETHHLIDASIFALMKEEAVLVNVARGPVVDETALIAALGEGSIGGAGLDVFEVEPLAADSPLRGFGNVVLGSHNANNLRSAVEAVHANTLSNLKRILT
nr:phosphoglycerate dehydrogenase [Acuticoccus mangrovi]